MFQDCVLIEISWSIGKDRERASRSPWDALMWFHEVAILKVYEKTLYIAWNLCRFDGRRRDPFAVGERIFFDKLGFAFGSRRDSRPSVGV